MLIRAKNRLYYYDKHISDAILRLFVFFATVLIAITSYLLVFKTTDVIDEVLWIRLQDEIAILVGREVTKFGTSEKTLFTQVYEMMEKDKAGITKFPDYAEKISPGNQSVEMVRLRIRDLTIALKFIGAIFFAVLLVLIILLRIIYGYTPRKWRLVIWLYNIFNKDNISRFPYSVVHSLSPIQKKIFEIAISLSKGNPDGSFDLDVIKIAKLMYPTDTNISEKKISLIAIAFTELCEEFFYFQVPAGKITAIKTYCPIIPFEDQVKREYVRDISGREVEVFMAGRFRFAPPLYYSYVKLKYSKLPHPVIYSLDDRKSPYAFKIYLLLWEKLCENKNSSQIESKSNMNTVKVSLYTLLDNVCFEINYDKDTPYLELLHSNIEELLLNGFIKNYYIEENNRQISLDWYKEVNLFNYDSNINQYYLNTSAIDRKIYTFVLASYEELDKIKLSKRRCAYVDSLNTPCPRYAMAGSPYCKLHSKAMEFETPKLFYDKVKKITGPTSQENDNNDVPISPNEPINSDIILDSGQNESNYNHGETNYNEINSLDNYNNTSLNNESTQPKQQNSLSETRNDQKTHDNNLDNTTTPAITFGMKKGCSGGKISIME